MAAGPRSGRPIVWPTCHSSRGRATATRFRRGSVTSATPASEWIVRLRQRDGHPGGVASDEQSHGVDADPRRFRRHQSTPDVSRGNAGVFNGEHRLSVVLDTRPAQPADWTFTFLVDGQTVKGPVAATGGVDRQRGPGKWGRSRWLRLSPFTPPWTTAWPTWPKASAP